MKKELLSVLFLTGFKLTMFAQIGQADSLKNGFIYKGNGTFVPSFSFCNKIFSRKCMIKEIEAILPIYSKSTPDTSDKKVTITYEFYSSAAPPTLVVQATFSGLIEKVTIFDAKRESDLDKKVLQAGYQIDTYANAISAKFGVYSAKHYKNPKTGIFFISNGNQYSWTK